MPSLLASQHSRCLPRAGRRTTGSSAPPPAGETARAPAAAPKVAWLADDDARLAPGHVVKATASAGAVKALLVKDESGDLLSAAGTATGALLPPGGTFVLAASAARPRRHRPVDADTVHAAAAEHVPAFPRSARPRVRHYRIWSSRSRWRFDRPSPTAPPSSARCSSAAREPPDRTGRLAHRFPANERAEYRPQKSWPANTTSPSAPTHRRPSRPLHLRRQLLVGCRSRSAAPASSPSPTRRSRWPSLTMEPSSAPSR